MRSTFFRSRFAKLALLWLVSTLSSGCLAATTLITVKSDASGTIEQTLVMSPTAVAQLQQMMAMGQAAGGGSKPTELFSEQEARNAATRIGDGVTYVSSQRLKTADGEGLKALYAFTDVRKLRLSERPTPPGSAAMPGVTPPGRGGSDDLTFRFSGPPAGNPTVTVVFPSPPAGGRQSAPDTGRGGQMPPEAMAMARQMFKGLRIDIAMQVDGRIVRTNSPYVDGSKVTLLAIDFEQFLDDPALLGDLQKLQSIEAVRSRLGGVKGVKINPDNEVSVEFTR
ncbi:MAG: hypothetical protein HYS05_15135 [Acidobacteria bacterium]|nr:hypothetical protein [Acidobacteriota bacterium]